MGSELMEVITGLAGGNLAGETPELWLIVRNHLNEIAWNDLGQPVTANGPTATMDDVPGSESALLWNSAGGMT